MFTDIFPLAGADSVLERIPDPWETAKRSLFYAPLLIVAKLLESDRFFFAVRPRSFRLFLRKAIHCHQVREDSVLVRFGWRSNSSSYSFCPNPKKSAGPDGRPGQEDSRLGDGDPERVEDLLAHLTFPDSQKDQTNDPQIAVLRWQARAVGVPPKCPLLVERFSYSISGRSAKIISIPKA